MEVPVMATNSSWLLGSQSSLLLIGVFLLYLFIYWSSGGRQSFYERTEAKEERWRNVFEVCGVDATEDIAGVRVASRLAQKCDKPLTSLLHDSVLDFSSSELDDSDAEALGTLLQINPRLEVLELAHNRCGPSCVAAIASAKPAALRKLDLSDNALAGEEAGEALRTLVLSCPALAQLSLSMNRLGDEGTVKLAAAIRAADSAVSSLALSGNSIGDEGALALGAAIQLNARLSTLAATRNPGVSPTALVALRAAWGNRKGHLFLDDDVDE